MVEKPEPLASTTASLVAGAALGGSDQPAELAAWPGLAHLVAVLQHVATVDPALQAALAAVTAAPKDPAEVAALARAVAALASRDSGLRAELEGLLDQGHHHPTAGGLVTQIAGHARVGKLVTIGNAGQVHVHLPPAPPPTVLDQLPPTHPGAAVSNLPPRNRVFTGRGDLLARLHQQLTTRPLGAVAVTATPADTPDAADATTTEDMGAVPQVLHGLGGVGKTQLVLEYAHQHPGDYAIRWWIPAEQPAAIGAHLVALARRLGITEQPEQAETVAVLLDELGRRDRWLLVFDNAEDPRDLHPYWPSTAADGQVLVTSRNPNWQALAATVPVDVLPRPDAVAFLQWRGGIDKDNADALAAALGDLPLALEQAAAYLEQTHTPPGEYLELLATRARELFALGRPATSEQTIATIWSVSLQRLHAEAPAAEELLHLCAFLAPDDIPRWLLQDHPNLLSEPLAEAVRDRLGYQQALAALGRYSLVAITEDAISVHRLVQEVVRHQLDPNQARQCAAIGAGLVLAAFPQEPGDVAAWPVSARLLPHALTTSRHADLLGVEPEETAVLLNRAARYLWQRAEHTQAAGLLKRALSIREAHLGADHLTTAQSLNNLATVLHDQGDLDTARTMHERALTIYETRLGADHPTTAHSLNNLAAVLHAQGDLNHARTHHERALTICEARLGSDHPTTATSLTNLATVLHAQGDLNHARPLYERALAIREARLGSDHPATVRSRERLAAVVAELENHQ
jgi:tetratricopeptide (TPR) repeat protein